MELYYYCLDPDCRKGGWLEADIEDVVSSYETNPEGLLDFAFEDEEGNFIKLRRLPDFMRTAFIERLDLQKARRNKAAKRCFSPSGRPRIVNLPDTLRQQLTAKVSLSKRTEP